MMLFICEEKWLECKVSEKKYSNNSQNSYEGMWKLYEGRWFNEQPIEHVSVILPKEFT